MVFLNAHQLCASSNPQRPGTSGVVGLHPLQCGTMLTDLNSYAQMRHGMQLRSLPYVEHPDRSVPHVYDYIMLHVTTVTKVIEHLPGGWGPWSMNSRTQTCR